MFKFIFKEFIYRKKQHILISFLVFVSSVFLIIITSFVDGIVHQAYSFTSTSVFYTAGDYHIFNNENSERCDYLNIPITNIVNPYYYNSKLLQLKEVDSVSTIVSTPIKLFNAESKKSIEYLTLVSTEFNSGNRLFKYFDKIVLEKLNSKNQLIIDPQIYNKIATDELDDLYLIGENSHGQKNIIRVDSVIINHNSHKLIRNIIYTNKNTMNLLKESNNDNIQRIIVFKNSSFSNIAFRISMESFLSDHPELCGLSTKQRKNAALKFYKIIRSLFLLSYYFIIIIIFLGTSNILNNYFVYYSTYDIGLLRSLGLRKRKIVYYYYIRQTLYTIVCILLGSCFGILLVHIFNDMNISSTILEKITGTKNVILYLQPKNLIISIFVYYIFLNISFFPVIFRAVNNTIKKMIRRA